MKADVAVIGAGMVGVSTAIALARRGADVVLIDRRAPGRETSFGNAGVIQREGVHPYLFPRSLSKLIAYALNRRTEAHYHLSSLPAVAPFLWRYFRASNPGSARRTYEANIPLFGGCLDAHADLAAEAGAEELIAKKGWLRVFRSDAALRAVAGELAELEGLGLSVSTPDAAALAALEPHLKTDRLAGAVHYEDPWTCSDPGALTGAYARLFERLGGETVERNVAGLGRDGDGWRVETDHGPVAAGAAVLAAGPWSKALLEPLGLNLPMGIKRGYHRHYAPAGNGYLTRTIVDDEHGFVMAPMARGVRVTSGAEFARHDAPPTPVQLDRAMPHARALFDLDEAVDDEAWMGARPVFPDMLPVMGEAPGLPGLWLNFGHGHQGFTLGPVAGRLVAAMMTGQSPDFDPVPYRAGRFS
ncbi:NAD(P)/FAD-dependent oxidoreductase [Oceaniradius stylonematis]|nr:FAD-dependent oxidoreductase [Oceaniradius stylonematis]